MKFKTTKSNNLKVKPNEKVLGFGKYFTDHMFIADYDNENGWHNARIIPYGNLSLSPASTVLHYGAEIFEGMKAYLTSDDKIQLFRPYDNAKRTNVSADRLCLPQIDEEIFVNAIKELVMLDKSWIPTSPGTSLYIRPFMFGNDETLGVHTVNKATFVIILSPVGSYYKEGINPVKIMIETEDVRAVRGGTGYAKCGGNYGASTRAAKRAGEKGYSQVLWLDGVEKKYIEEVGAMNVMFKINGEVVTPELSGSILPGITRDSCIQILKDKGISVSERKISLEELIASIENKTLEEAWGCGTAAVISPIGLIDVNDIKYEINDNQIGEVSQMLYDEITGIQNGTIKDTRNWIVEVK